MQRNVSLYWKQNETITETNIHKSMHTLSQYFWNCSSIWNTSISSCFHSLFFSSNVPQTNALILTSALTTTALNLPPIPWSVHPHTSHDGSTPVQVQLYHLQAFDPHSASWPSQSLLHEPFHPTAPPSLVPSPTTILVESEDPYTLDFTKSNSLSFASCINETVSRETLCSHRIANALSVTSLSVIRRTAAIAPLLSPCQQKMKPQNRRRIFEKSSGFWRRCVANREDTRSLALRLLLYTIGEKGAIGAKRLFNSATKRIPKCGPAATSPNNRSRVDAARYRKRRFGPMPMKNDATVNNNCQSHISRHMNHSRGSNRCQLVT